MAKLKESILSEIKRDRVLRRRIRMRIGTTHQGLDYMLRKNSNRLIGIDVLDEVATALNKSIQELYDDGN